VLLPRLLWFGAAILPGQPRPLRGDGDLADAGCWNPADSKRENAFIARGKLTAGADVVYVNHDSIFASEQSVAAELLDGLFNERRLGG